MKSRGRWGVRCWRAVGPAALLVSLALSQVSFRAPLAVQAAAPLPGRPNLATYAGAPATGKPTEVAQQPFGLAVLGRYTFVADPVNHVVRMLIDKQEAVFAGTGSLATAADGRDLASAQLAGPYAVAIGNVTSNGPYQVTRFDVYIADTFAHQLRKVHVEVPPIDSPSGAQSAEISTIAGTGSFGLAGDGAAATAAQLNSPYGVAWDDKHHVLYVADTLNNRVRSIGVGNRPTDPPGTPPSDGGGIIRTVLAAPLNHPRGLAVDGDGLYIADSYNHVIRRYDLITHTLTVAAGTGTAGYVNGLATSKAQLRLPAALAFDSEHNLYIADTGNHAIRELTAADHVVTTVAGTGKSGKFGDDGPAILAELSAPMGVAVRPNGDVVIADTGNNLVRVLEGTLSSGPTHNIHVEAGNGTPSFAGDGQPPGKAQFGGPAAVVSQLSNDGPPNPGVPAVTGRRYVVDTFNQAVRTFSTDDRNPRTNTDVMSTLLGTGGVRGSPGSSSQPLAGSRMAYPMGSAIDAPRNRLYVADTFNNVVRAVDLNSKTVTTVAGTAGPSGYSGDGGPATRATLSYPTGVAVDAAGNLFIADTYNGRIREVIASSGKIATVAGTGRLGFSGDNGDARAADLYFPYGVTLDTATPPNLYITDSFNHRIRRVDAASHVIRTVAGDGAQAFGDGTVGQAHFNRPWSATIDQNNLFIADFLNHRVRRVDLTGQTVATLGGRATSGLQGDAGPADQAEADGPRGLSMLGDTGAILLADSFNNRVRWLGVTQAGIQRTEVNFDPTNLAGQSQPQSVTVSSTGSGLLVMGAVDLDDDRNNFYLDPLKNTCANTRLEPGSSCSFDVAFQPRSPGGHNGSVVIPNDATGGPQKVVLRGMATAAIVTLSPPAVVINQAANGPPNPATVTLTNNGDGLLHIESIALDPGTDPDFSQSNNCPSVMPAHSSCQITISLSRIAADDKRTRTGRLTVKDDAAGTVGGATTQSVPLTGSLAQSIATFAPQTLIFTQNVGRNSAPEALVLRNSGQAPLHLSAIRDAGDFVQTNNCPQTLNPGASCVISVTFIPTNIGERSGYIVIADDSIDSPQKIPVMGIATMAMSRLGPDRLNFSQNVGTASSPQTVTLANRGDGPLTIAGIAATGDFRAAPRCPPVLAPGISCSISVTFTPSAPGVRKGSLIVTNDANALPGSQDTVRLSGFGYQPVASLSTAALAPNANLGSSAGQSMTVTNTGDGVLNIRALAIGGGAAADYSQSNNCLRALPPGSSCSITVRFTPHGYGLRNATLTLFDDGRGGSQSIVLRGTGTAPRPLLSSGFINFGGSGVGNPSVPQQVVLFNSGNGVLSIGSVVLSGADFVMTTSCGRTLQAGASCVIRVAFVPRATGARSGVVTISDSAGARRITLSGVGT